MTCVTRIQIERQKIYQLYHFNIFHTLNEDVHDLEKFRAKVFTDFFLLSESLYL